MHRHRFSAGVSAGQRGDTEDRWTEIFRSFGRTYEPPRLVLFSGATRSARGAAQSAMGPFYCPYDQRLYLDTGFFREIETRLDGCNVGSKNLRVLGSACDCT
jgi:predicted metalloprotease